MKDMIYYPGFEVRDETWLKFALLYFDCLRPIIPTTIAPERDYISDSFCKIMDETDLIRPYRPDYKEGWSASRIACKEFEDYLRHPYNCYRYFGEPHANRLIDKWQNPEYQESTLFDGKYSGEFFEFCVRNHIATPCDEGIKIASDLAYVYMSFLADIISKNNELEMITDVNRYSALLLANGIHHGRQQGIHLQTAQNNIQLALPDDLENISLSEIISLRRDPSFNSARKAYMQQILNLIESREGKRPYCKLEDVLSYQKEYIKICEGLFSMLATVTISAVSFSLAAEAWQNGSFIPAAATAYVDFEAIRRGAGRLPEFVEGLNNKRLARKYVARLGKLNSRRSFGR